MWAFSLSPIWKLFEVSYEREAAVSTAVNECRLLRSRVRDQLGKLVPQYLTTRASWGVAASYSPVETKRAVIESRPWAKPTSDCAAGQLREIVILPARALTLARMA